MVLYHDCLFCGVDLEWWPHFFSAHGDVEETTSQTMSDPNIEFHHLKLGDLQYSSGDKIHGTNLILFFSW